jgi:uncharacterized protein (TIGR03000 family)
MTRACSSVLGVFLAFVFLTSARGQQTGQTVTLRVLLPNKDAELTIEGKATKQKGVSRVFVSPPLEPGWKYAYTLTATWEPNNYTKVFRTKVASLRPGTEVVVDLRKADPKNPDKFLIRYVPTPQIVVAAMCKLAGVKKGDVVFDLGCGDGRIVITAVTDFGAKRGVGVDIDPERIAESVANAEEEKVSDKVKFRQGDVLQQIKDLGDASVVMLYMGRDVNLRLMPILKKTLKPGSRIVSHDFDMGSWKAEKTLTVEDEYGDEHLLYLWTVGKKDR